MRYVLIAIAVAAFCVPAFAQDGGNNTAKVFVTFTTPTPDNGSVVNRVDPTQYTAFSAYFGITDLGDGMKSISFRASVTPGVSSTPAFVNLLPGDLAIGNWETGVTLASTECMNTDSHPGREYIDPVIFARLDLFYLGGVGDVTILDDPEYPRWVVDCTDPPDYNFFCIWTHGGVGKDAEPGDAECEANTPVESQTWGAIKALYR